MRIAAGAVAAVAARELRRTWRFQIAAGLAAGLLGAVVVGTLAVARRTATAVDRLVEASAVEDARVMVFAGDPALPGQIAALPGVDQAWIGSLAVAQVEGRRIEYVGTLLGPPRPPQLLRPVVVSGRAADPRNPNEAVAVEAWARESGVVLGQRLVLTFLTRAEFHSFDQGFGHPDGPRVEVTITGMVRVPGAMHFPVYLSPAAVAGPLADPQVRAASTVLLRLRAGVRGVPAIRAGVAATASDATLEEAAGEFAPVQVEAPADQFEALTDTRRLLVGGLGVVAALSLLAGGWGLGQAFLRRQQAGATDQRVESAIGLTGAERAAGRAWATVPAAAAAALLTLAGGLVAGRFEAMGAMAGQEPHPGTAPNVGLAVLGALTIGGAVVALTAFSARRAGRASPPLVAASWGFRLPAAAQSVGRISPSAAATAGLALALPQPRARTTAVRATVAGTVVGIAGLVAASTVASSRDRLLATPARWGWQADGYVLNADQDVLDQLLGDPRLASLTLLDRATVPIAGEELPAHTLQPVRGSLGWTVLAGRPPERPDEVMVGLRLKYSLDVEPGDRISSPAGGLRVVGTGLGPPIDGELLGKAVLLHPSGVGALTGAVPVREAIVSVAPGLDPAEVLQDLSAGLEVRARTPPPDVADLGELGRLPSMLAAILGGVGAGALVHALASTARRRRRDLATLRALGFVPGQAAVALAVVALLHAVAGLVGGLPLGLGIGRLVWATMAHTSGVAIDPAVPWRLVAAVAALVPVVAIAASVLPARSAARLRPAAILRAE